jgi:hypothetical protein
LNSLAFFRGRLGAKAPSYQHPAPSEEQEQGQGQKKKQIPCGNDKQKGKDKYGDSGCARMTTLYVRQNDGQRETNND